MISAGILTEKIIPLTATIRRGAMGEQLEDWTEGEFIRARVTYARGARALNFGEAWMANSISVLIRYTKRINDRSRFRWEGSLYQIDSFNGSYAEGSITITASKIDEGTNEQ